LNGIHHRCPSSVQQPLINPLGWGIVLSLVAIYMWFSGRLDAGKKGGILMMKDLASVITAIGAIGWPLALVFLTWKLMPTLKSRLSAGDVTFKGFGTEITLQEASRSVEKQLADLQEKVTQLRSVVEQVHPEVRQTMNIAGVQESHPGERILWVDDHPANNAFEIARLRRLGATVDQVTSTDEALQSLTHDRYTKVVTDMERTENGHVTPQAGISLIKRMHENDITTPVFVYCSIGAVDLYHDKALAEGAADVTSSPVELFEKLGLSGVSAG
jgi:CheY-like chemotaxis protein